MNEKMKKILVVAAIIVCMCGSLGVGVKIGKKVSRFETYAMEEVNEVYYPGVYKPGNILTVLAQDDINFMERKSMPPMERMSSEDRNTFIAGLKVVKRANDLGLTMGDVMKPEKAWKELYYEINSFALEPETVAFDGSLASELNAFMKANEGKRVVVNNVSLELDDTLHVPANTQLVGRGTLIEAASSVKYCFHMENVENISIEGFEIHGGSYGVYLLDCRNVVVKNCVVKNCKRRGIVLYEGENINLANNEMSYCRHGGLFMLGSCTKVLVEGNEIVENTGAENLSAGICMTSNESSTREDPDEGFETQFIRNLSEKKDAPNRIVIRNNVVANNNSSGIYNDGSYLVYVIDNQIYANDTEGMCMDFGTIGTYIARNSIVSNGFRARQTNADLEMDYVLGLGRMADGSSPAKLPGLSMDNTMWNIITENFISNNAGSGIKSVRTTIQTLICDNIIDGNNAGESEAFHFFAIELGAANDGSQEQQNMSVAMDFVPNYENIICRNHILGGHYSGIYLAPGCYINDIYENSIYEPKVFSIECQSEKFNSSMRNYSNTESIGLRLW